VFFIAVNTCFASQNGYCSIFEENCPYKKEGECDYYFFKRGGFPDGFLNYLQIVSIKAQARSNRSQQKFNKYLIILSTLAIIIAIISFIVSLFN
jgi:hypothetical protein